MAERAHSGHAPGCPNCNAETRVEPEVCGCLTDGFGEGLKRWADSCPCCFGDAYPQGLEKALEEAMA
jgi:hypothetical protein